MAKNIVVCLDGTGNRIATNRSSVSRIFNLLNEPCKFYDTGIGTDSNFNDWERFRTKARSWWQLGTGAGLDDKLLTAYRFICRNFHETKAAQDEIYIFGFSRGAYCARALAGFIHNFGLLDPNNLHLADDALVAYKNINRRGGDTEEKYREMRRLEKTLSTKRPQIAFLGLFDTVNSVMIPGAGALTDVAILDLPNTRHNYSVRQVAHAVAIDEKRMFFRPELWEGTEFKENVYDTETKPQIVAQEWFAGVHGDIGGSTGAEDNPLGKVALQWMYEQTPEGLNWRRSAKAKICGGTVKAGKTSRTYAAPNGLAPLADSMTKWWGRLERLRPLPKAQWISHLPRKSFLGRVWPPIFQPRHIPTEHDLHKSVMLRHAELGYEPEPVKDYLRRRAAAEAQG